MAQEAEAPRFVPVEIYGCNYLKGKDYGDLQRVIDKWNVWMDENGVAPYTAWTLTPFYTSRTEYDFDVAWLGAWADGAGMGATHQQWVFGDSMQEEFDKVVDCPMHTGYASANLKMPASWPNETGVTVFSDCKATGDKTAADAYDMEKAWADYMGSMGSEAGIWIMYNGPGVSDNGWQYKHVVGHADFASFGAGFETITNKGGWMKGAEIFGDNAECNGSRVYATQLIRDGGVSPN